MSFETSSNQGHDGSRRTATATGFLRRLSATVLGQTIRARIARSFALVLLLVAVQTVVSWRMLRVVNQEVVSVRDSQIPGLLLMERVKTIVGEIQLDVARALMSPTAEQRKEMIDRIFVLRTEVLKLMDEYKASLTEDADRSLFAEMEAARDAYVACRARVLALILDGKLDEARVLNADELRPLFVKYQDLTNQLMEREIAHAREGTSHAAEQSSRLVWLVLGTAGAVLAAGVVLSVVVSASLNRVLRTVANSLDEGSQQVASAASQVSAASQTLAQGASEQAASLEETSSSLEELSSTAKRNAESSQQAKELARAARDVAESGSTEMARLRTAMKAIDDSSREIGKIVRTIDEIAFQTNILALNAAVEAARAGEAGAGFAVVADEVRALAQRSAESARETATKVEGALRDTTVGVQISERVSVSLTEIVQKARKVDELVAEVNAASSEQNDGVQQINTAVTQMDKVVQASAGNAEETAAAAQELNAQSHTMRAAVQSLVSLVGGGRRDSAAEQRAPKPEPEAAPAAQVPAESRWRPVGALPDRRNFRPARLSRGRAPEFPLVRGV